MRRKKGEKYCLGLETPRERCLECPYPVCKFERVKEPNKQTKYIIRKTLVRMDGKKRIVSYILRWQPRVGVFATKDIKKALKISKAEAGRVIREAKTFAKRNYIFEMIKAEE